MVHKMKMLNSSTVFVAGFLLLDFFFVSSAKQLLSVDVTGEYRFLFCCLRSFIVIIRCYWHQTRFF